MALRTFVKVSGINNLSDARYCAGMEVNQLGFEIEEKSDNYIDPQTFKEIKGWLSGVEFVGEINTPNTPILTLIEQYELDAVQVQDLNQLKEAFATGLKVIFKANNLDDAKKAFTTDFGQLLYVLLENATPDDGLLNLAKLHPVVLAADFDTPTLMNLIKSDIMGVAIKGGDEIRPGYKDFDEMAEILEALEIDDLA